MGGDVENLSEITADVIGYVRGGEPDEQVLAMRLDGEKMCPVGGDQEQIVGGIFISFLFCFGNMGLKFSRSFQNVSHFEK